MTPILITLALLGVALALALWATLRRRKPQKPPTPSQPTQPTQKAYPGQGTFDAARLSDVDWSVYDKAYQKPLNRDLADFVDAVQRKDKIA